MSKLECPICVAAGLDVPSDPSRLEVNPKLYVRLEWDGERVVAIVDGIELDMLDITCDHSGHTLTGGSLRNEVADAVSALQDVLMDLTSYDRVCID